MYIMSQYIAEAGSSSHNFISGHSIMYYIRLLQALVMVKLSHTCLAIRYVETPSTPFADFDVFPESAPSGTTVLDSDKIRTSLTPSWVLKKGKGIARMCRPLTSQQPSYFRTI